MTPPDSTPFALDLLPAEHEAPRCAVHAANIEVDPGGTAIAASAVAIVELPLPWPKPVFAHPLMSGLASMMELRCGPTRVLAAEPRSGADDRHRVTVYERNLVGTIGTVLEFPAAQRGSDDVSAEAPSNLGDLFELLAAHYPLELSHLHAAEPAPDLALLACTQGSHDVCCGSDGMRFANAMAEAAPGLAVFKVSHTGGHRFAPTAMTIPDGRMWSHLDVDTALAILDVTAAPTAVAPKCRGWWGAATGPAQVAERAVFERVGWDLDMMPREVEATETPSGWSVRVEVARQIWTVEVAAGRTIPTISCRAEGGQPAKVGREYDVVWVTPPT